MKMIILLFLPLYFFLSGCSSKIDQVKIDDMKSCRALSHEKEELQKEIVKFDPEKRKSVNPMHYGVVTVGALASIPLLNTTGFYILPAITITYYNLFIGQDKERDKLEYLQSREKIISDLQRRKNCKPIY